MADTEKPSQGAADVVRRLQGLRVVLGIDSPETRGWAPAIQQEARRVVDAAIAALSSAPPVGAQGWISVHDRLPEVGTDCLVWSHCSWEKAPSVKMDRWDEQREAPLSFSSATIPIGPGWDDHDDFDSVTHWMLLPDGPAAPGAPVERSGDVSQP